MEVVGGFFARSQALKADALDFLGDVSITLVGLFALAWAEHTRARVALTPRTFPAFLQLAPEIFRVSYHAKSRPGFPERLL